MAQLIPALQIFTSDPEISNSTPTAYSLTDHNRQALEISYELIEDVNRMADGTMRKYVTANKKKILVTWQTVPAAGGRNFTADGNLGAAFLKSFYEENVFKPVWVRMTYANENWAYANTVQNVNTGTSLSTNTTFSPTAFLPASAAYPFYVTSASVSSFSNGVASAVLTTSIPHSLTTSNAQYIYVTGIDQLYNGTWKISSTGSTTVSYVFGANGNANADFNINSYSQSGSVASFNIDNTDFIQTGASITAFNTKGYSGNINNINATWLVTNIVSNNIFTAVNSTYSASGTSYGYYGTGQIISSNGSSKNVNQIYPGFVGPAIASDIVKTFITNFSYNITHRYALTDYVDMSIEFTEI